MRKGGTSPKEGLPHNTWNCLLFTYGSKLMGTMLYFPNAQLGMPGTISNILGKVRICVVSADDPAH